MLQLKHIFVVQKKKMKQINALLALSVLSLVFFSSCKKDDPKEPVIPNEEEVITTLNLTLTPVGGGTPVEFKFKDLDGDGGNPPVISVGKLDTNTQYTGSIALFNELESPADTITLEVEEEADEHQFFFESTANGLTVAYDDADDNGKPLGIATTITTQGASTGTLTITLRHEPIKDAAGVSMGDITNAGGETDIEVTFDVGIE